MVKVKVRVNNLAIDVDGKEMRFRRGDVFEIPAERAAGLGNSVLILENIPEPEQNPPDTVAARKRK
ncbi:hypothetical protein [Methanolobus halotolerans]|uniref:Uncharacterized protein n=1 Tax=Methanolobus halotolerans TaxID=2052935 RepID=A0A4E0Q3K2_9EURY|nr:hypothetical protein [Methanolobus halotolerans]TGC08122.1 hypothetical protein CUN85_09880 [Methanolobus halotolerans]